MAAGSGVITAAIPLETRLCLKMRNKHINESGRGHNMLRFICKAIFVLISLMTPIACLAEDIHPADLVDVYSDLSQSDDGDISGIELRIIYSKTGYSVLFQDAEGVLRKPLLVDALVNGHRIVFTLPARDGYSGTFSGEFSVIGIVGQFESGQISPQGEKYFHLKKGATYWNQDQIMNSVKECDQNH